MFENIYFVNGTACAGKSTLVHLLAEKHGGIECGENYHDALLPGLAMDGPHIAVDRTMAASVPGVFAAGDCVGAPYQVAKAVGEGNVAALSAARYLEDKTSRRK